MSNLLDRKAARIAARDAQELLERLSPRNIERGRGPYISERTVSVDMYELARHPL
jgi:hypothetical protein